MKKSILLLILSLSLNTIILSQDEDMMEKSTYSEFGVNATSFINEFLSLNNNDADLGDYMIVYKYHMGDKAFRAGLGGNFSQLNEDVDGGGSRESKNNNIQFRIGYEYKKPITNKWLLYTGIDVIGGAENSVSNTQTFENIKITNSTTSFGGGPILGIQFFINPNISLGTEGSLYYRYSIVKEKEEFSINSEFNFEDTSNTNQLDFGLPTALFFMIRF